MPPSKLPEEALHCSICPKTKAFSDVSHLLTHIASKSHLSTYYNVKVLANTDAVAQADVEFYNDWYDRWQIEELMSTRLEVKKANVRKRKAAKEEEEEESKAKTKKRKISPKSGTMPFAIDPQLPRATSSYEIPYIADATPPKAEVSASRPYRPRMYLWSTSRPAAVDAVLLEPSSPLASHSTGLHSAVPFAQMTTKSPSTTPSNAPADGDNEVGEVVLKDVAKLKGIHWPGMAIFDAATPEMKRKRNQKKEENVAIRLKRSSKEVEAMETIWQKNLEALYKERPITGQVDFDSSPYKLEALSPEPGKKARRRKTMISKPDRPALAELDTNVLQPRRKAKKSTTSSLPVLAPFGNIQPSGKDPKKRKRKTAVLDERPTEQLTSTTSATGMRYLTAEFQHNPQLRPQPVPVPHHPLVDPNYAAYYQPALQHGFYPGAFYHMPQPVYGYYGPSGHVNHDIPGFFSYPPQAFAVHQQPTHTPAVEELADDEDEDSHYVKLLTGSQVFPTPSEDEKENEFAQAEKEDEQEFVPDAADIENEED